MKQIPLTQGKVAIVDDEDYEWLSRWKWYYFDEGYAARNDRREKGKRKTILMHRVIMKTLKNMLVDHMNHDGLDNQKSNLRNCTHDRNLQNRLINKNNKSGYKGVCWHKCSKKWVASIRFNGKGIHIGCYPSREQSARAYDKAARELFGDFAKTNFEAAI